MITIEEPITLYIYGRNEKFDINRGSHQRMDGFVIKRSVLNKSDIYEWDGNYYFFWPFQEVINAIVTGTYEKGKIDI